ncbi:MAG: NAD(P)/FAD-dependent oxidoreductase [Bacteroidota bacterium]
MKNLEESLPSSDLPRVVIIGGGFAGIELVQKLRRCPVETVMLDKNNYHTFIPLLYQVATAGLSPGDISSPLREFLQDDPHFHFRLAEVERVDTKKRQLHTSLGLLTYDYLILASGSKTNFFGNEKIERGAQKLREISDAISLRTHIIGNFEKALLATGEEEMQRFMNVVIVGGGPTGAELAGAIGELRDHVLPKDYPELDFKRMQIFLVEGNERVLSAMSPFASRKSKKYLEEFGVKVILENRVVDFEDHQVTLSDGTVIPTACLIWSAGVQGNFPEGFQEEAISKGRLHVNEYHRVLGQDHVYAIGDVAYQEQEGWPQGLPMLAPVAIQQARNLGRNLHRAINGQEPKAMKYVDKGTMATIGRNRAVVDAPGWSFGGFFGWFVWMFIHLVSIMGFRRKLLVFSNWVWNYLSYNRGNRLIINIKERN